jgi:predicted AAA+ superfamily ATPase
MLDVLIRWNRWGKALLKSGLKRQITPAIIDLVNTSDVIVLMGPRRAGKSTILYQVIDHLEKSGTDPKAILHINFEEPLLAAQLELSLLDKLYDIYRAEVYPTGKAYIFLDEIQNIPGWERWVRARNETEDIKIFVTGSSSQLMSRELGTLLTGRHIGFEIFPLNFFEFLSFIKVSLPEKPWSFTTPPEIEYALLQYCRYGGYPEVVLSDSEQRREMLLSQYFEDMLFKDVALRHNIRDLHTLRNLAIHLFGQTSSLLTFNRLANLFSVSTDLIKTYCHYFQEAYLLDLIPFFSLKVAERNRNPQKMHVIDLGLRNRFHVSGSPDKGKLIETLVYNHLRSNTDKALYYWKNNGEIDFLTHQGNQVHQLIQVMHDGVTEKPVFEREIKALEEAREKFPGAKGLLVINKIPRTWVAPKISGIEFVSLWHFILS